MLTLALTAALVGGQGPDPANTFDWTIHTGEEVILNTVSSVITNDPPTTTQVVTNGLVDVRNFKIEQGGKLTVQGPNPLILCAGGTVTIDGTLSVDGGDSLGVLTMNTTSTPEPGAPGHAGGGDGGTGSPFTSMSSPQGGNGFGAYGLADGGGRGGETGWSVTPATNERRGGGGGGGVFGPNQKPLVPTGGLYDQSAIGLDAEPGFQNRATGATGALSNSNPVAGGAVGPPPFLDGNPRNDFFGTMVVHGGATGVTIIEGELLQPWAGAGGGAGGDANRPKKPATTFPGWFSVGGDEKGAGGGGGAGAVRILSLGPIVFGPFGQVSARGGTGGGGENTLFLNRVGGGSGGGSGGHVILETAAFIDMSAAGSAAIDARGGQGGTGKNDVGGARVGPSGNWETFPQNDACPDGEVGCLGHVDGAGGDGGPGIIQLHAPRGLRDVMLAPGATLADHATPRPLCWEGGCRMVVGFPTSPDATPGRASELHDPRAWTLEDLRMGTAP